MTRGFWTDAAPGRPPENQTGYDRRWPRGFWTDAAPGQSHQRLERA